MFVNPTRFKTIQSYIYIYIYIYINISVYVQIHVLVIFLLKEVFFVCGIGTGEGNNS